MESSFPSPVEQIVASALLLLSLQSPRIEKSCKCDDDDDCSESFLTISTVSRSSDSSTVTGDDFSCERTGDRGLHLIARSVARSHRELKFKVVRKNRSKTLRISDCRKITNFKPVMVVSSGSAPSELTTEATSSCLSNGSGSSVSSSGRSCNALKKMDRALARGSKPKPSSSLSANSAHLRRRSEAILKLLAHIGSTSEVSIRQWLGDSPDTSKALRMLLKKGEVKRSGGGGRSDPFIYEIAQ